MDRFIDGKGSKQRVVPLFKIQYGQIYRTLSIKLVVDFNFLKSNMDRFIAFTNPRTKMITDFKIQYGQIYSP